MTSHILKHSVCDILRKYADCSLSPMEVVEACLDQIDKFNTDLNAFALIDDRENVMAQAEQSQKRWAQGQPMGRLDGVPITVKDWYHIPNWPTRYGSLTSDDKPQTEYSPATARLATAGGVFLGKTTLPEFGHKGVTDSPLNGVTRNPWDHTKTSGGSSGGAAVATATHMGLLHLGSDAGGSIRIPASFCGVFGMKPTPGLVPHWPQSLVSSLSSTGVMAQNVQDSALMLDEISKPDRRDWNAVPYQDRGFAEHCRHERSDLRIAYIKTINDIPIEPDVETAVAQAIDHAQGFAKVEEILLNIEDLNDVFGKHWTVAAHLMVEQMGQAEREKCDPSFLYWAEKGRHTHLNAYLEAELARMQIGHQMKQLFEHYDVLMMPTMAVTAFGVGQNAPIDPKTGAELEYWTPLTFPANLAKLPAASLPCGVGANGLPIGVQIIGDYLEDLTVLQVSHALEQRLLFQGWMDYFCI